MKNQIEKPQRFAEEYPIIDKIATEIQESVCRKINSINLPDMYKVCQYYRQGILEEVIFKLEKCV